MSVTKTNYKKINRRASSVETRRDDLDVEKDVVGLSVGEDKVLVDDPLLESSDSDSEADEIGLDDEDLNPFGDKWEV